MYKLLKSTRRHPVFLCVRNHAALREPALVDVCNRSPSCRPSNLVSMMVGTVKLRTKPNSIYRFIRFPRFLDADLKFQNARDYRSVVENRVFLHFYAPKQLNA